MMTYCEPRKVTRVDVWVCDQCGINAIDQSAHNCKTCGKPLTLAAFTRVSDEYTEPAAGANPEYREALRAWLEVSPQPFDVLYDRLDKGQYRLNAWDVLAALREIGAVKEGELYHLINKEKSQ